MPPFLRQLIHNFVNSRLITLRILLYELRSSNSYIGNPVVYQPVLCTGEGRIEFGENVRIGVSTSPFFHSTYAYLDARRLSAVINIGSGTWINNNFRALAEQTSISIGERCYIGSNVEVLDSNFHGLRVEDRSISKPEWAAPVDIGNDVFIGSNVTILKGVSIGDGAVIGSGSVVARSVPPAMIAAGNPAKVLRSIP